MVEQAALKSFIPYDSHHPFPLENIPFGVHQTASGERHCVTRIGEFVIDLAVLEKSSLFKGEHFSKLERKDIFSSGTLNAFMELGKPFWTEARHTL